MAHISLPTNLSEVEAGGNFEVLPLGQYTVEIEKVEVKHSPGKDHPYLAMKYNITEGPTDNCAGRKLFDNISMAPQALFKFKQLTLACNLAISDEFDTDDLLGNSVTVVIKHENKLDAAKQLKIGADGTPEKREVIDRYIYE